MDVVKVYMKWKHVIFSVLFLVAAFCVTASGQATPTQCPPDLVCLTPAAARAALEAGDKAKALEAAAKVKDQAIADLKAENVNWRVKYVEVFGRYDEIKQQRVEWMAEKEMLLKLIRPKKIGLINLF